MIALRPLREDEYADWDAAHRAEYARGLISHVGMSPEDAEAKVERDVAGVLPEGWRRRDEDLGGRGRRPQGRHGLRRHPRRGAWLYDITIDEDERGAATGGRR